MHAPTPTLLGYRARRLTTPYPGIPAIVTHIASVSDCIPDPIAPDRSDPEWDHVNMAFHYPSPQAAREAAVRLGRATDPTLTLETLDPTIEIHATRLYPWICYNRGDIETLVIDASITKAGGTDPQPLPTTATLLGFDVIAPISDPRTDHLARLPNINFACAPLSCNNEAANYPVNRWCLLDTLEDARRAMEDFAETEPEPGPYMIAEVWRC